MEWFLLSTAIFPIKNLKSLNSVYFLLKMCKFSLIFKEKEMNLSGCVPGSTEITELDVQRQNINMVAVKQTKIIPIVFALPMEFFYSYKMASYKLSEIS